MQRSANCLAKLERMNKTLRHQEADRVPSAISSGAASWSAGARARPAPDADIYRYYDLDWIQVTIPNMDPHIKPFEC
jgi:hypothetical protein